MSKPDDIPQDVWDRAAMLWGHEARIGIARAIMAERERCARVVETFVTSGDDDPRKQVAAAIRGEA